MWTFGERSRKRRGARVLTVTAEVDVLVVVTVVFSPAVVSTVGDMGLGPVTPVTVNIPIRPLLHLYFITISYSGILEWQKKK